MLTLSGSLVAASSAGSSPGSGCAVASRRASNPNSSNCEMKWSSSAAPIVEPPAASPIRAWASTPDESACQTLLPESEKPKYLPFARLSTTASPSKDSKTISLLATA